MLFLFNKAKIISYVVSVFTVIALFAVANVFISNRNTMETSANIVENNVYINKTPKYEWIMQISTFYVDKTGKRCYNIEVN